MNSMEVRELNKRVLGPKDQKCCVRCLTIYDGIAENFRIHSHRGKSKPTYESRCRTCALKEDEAKRARYRQSPRSMIVARVAQIRARAKKEDLPFDLDADYLEDLWIKQGGECYYTGQKIDFSLTTEKGTHPHYYQPSLDKKNPALGYVKGNVVWCAYVVNRMKNDCTEEKFIDLCRLVLQTKGEY